MKITLVRAMTRSAVFELLNDSCYRAPAPYTVQLNGEAVLDGDTNVFSLFSLQPGTEYTLTVSDGSLAYYFSEPVVENDAKGVGPLLLAYTEILAAKA